MSNGLAMLMLEHKWSEKTHRLITDALKHNITVFIHLDQKSSFGAFKQYSSNDNVIFVERYPIFWGGFNMVLAMLSLLKSANQHKHNFKFFIFVSGQDTLNPSVLFSESAKVEIPILEKIDTSTFCGTLSALRIKGGWRVDNSWRNLMWGHPSWRPLKKVYNNFRALLWCGKKMHCNVLIKSTQWLFLDRAMSDYLCRPEVENKLKRDFRDFRTPDEWAIPSILHERFAENFVFKKYEKTIYGRHLINWENPKKPSPGPLCLDELLPTPAWFGRKVCDKS